MDKTFFPITGIEALYIAENVQDSADTYTAGAPEEFAPAESGEWGEEQGSKELYYNNVLQDIYYGIKKSTITVKISGIPAKKDASIRGVYYDAASGRAVSTGNEEPPYCALGMKINKGRGDYIYIWFPKGKFSGGKVTAETKTGDVSVQTLEYTFSALATAKQFNINGNLQGVTWVKGDTTDPAFSAASWFSQVQTPDAAVSVDPVAMSGSSPADGANNVAADANIVLTFNNPIASEDITLFDTETGNAIAVIKSWNAGMTILTLSHPVALENATIYLVSITGVIDIYGQKLTASGVNFITVS